MVAKRSSEGPIQGPTSPHKFDADSDGAFETNADGDVEPVVVDVTRGVERASLSRLSELVESSYHPDDTGLTTVADGDASVGIESRWDNLDKSLKSLSEVSRHSGIVAISQSDSPARRNQMARYGSDYWTVIQRSKDLIPEEQADAKAAFAEAFGGKVMVASGLRTEASAQSELDEEYQKFQERFGGSDTAKTKPKKPRAKYRAKIKKAKEKFTDNDQ